MEPIVEIKNASVVYNKGEGIREVGAIRDISFKIYPKEYVIFFGPSGCGKSTLMNIIAGLERVSDGSVLVGGKDLTDLSDEEMAVYHRHEVGFIFQAYNLIPTLSVLENIALPQLFDGVKKTDWDKNAMALAERFGIAGQVKRIPAELSGGQQQRVGVARALINNPALLLADEPTGNLDSRNARLVLDIFQDLNLKENKTVLLVTHSPEYLNEADRVFYLKDGRLIREVRNERRKRVVLDLERKKKEEEGKGEGGEKEKEKEKEKKALPVSELLKEFYRPARVEKEAHFITEFALHMPEDRIIKRIESIVRNHIAGRLSAYETIQLLDKPYFKGGAELNKRTAQRIGHLIEHVLANALILERAEALSDAEIQPTLDYLKKSLEAILLLDIPGFQGDQMEKIIRDRLRNSIGPVRARYLLHEPLVRGGAGLSLGKAHELQSYLELLILIASERAAINSTRQEVLSGAFFSSVSRDISRERKETVLNDNINRGEKLMLPPAEEEEHLLLVGGNDDGGWGARQRDAID